MHDLLRDLSLLAVIAALLADRHLTIRHHRAETRDLNHALVARHAGDLAALERGTEPLQRTRVEKTSDAPIVGL